MSSDGDNHFPLLLKMFCGVEAVSIDTDISINVGSLATVSK